MLEEISIKNLGIINNAHINFHPGLTVITGETGTGKSMLLNSLHLLSGKRSNINMITPHQTHSAVEGLWTHNNAKLLQDIEETGAIVEDNQIFINRTMKTDGKNRTVIGGKTCPNTILQTIGQQLLHIHGQADQTTLKNPTQQQNILDNYARKELQTHHEKYVTLYKQWKNSVKTLENTQKNATTIKRKINSLQTFINEYDNINPQENEDHTTEQRINTLQHTEEIQQHLQQSYAMLTNDSDEIQPPTQQLQEIAHTLKKITQYQPELENIYTQTNTIVDMIQE